MRKYCFLVIFIVFGFFSCEKENVEPKVVYPDHLQSVRTSNNIKLNWYSPLMLMDVAPGFFERVATTEKFEIYLSKNDTMNFIKLGEFNRDENSYEYSENEKGVDYFFKLKCLAWGAESSFSNLVWVNGGSNPEMISLLNIEVDYTFYLGDISQDESKLLYSRNITPSCCENTHVMIYDLRSGIEKQIVERANQPVFGPNENNIAFTSHFRIYNTTPWPTNLGMIDLVTNKIDTLTTGQNEVQSPIISTDGKSIYFLNTPYKHPEEINQLFLDGLIVENIYTAPEGLNVNGPISYSAPEGQLSFKGNYDDGTHGLYALDVNTKDIILLEEQRFWLEYKTAFSEDGKYLAFFSNRSGQKDIWVKNLFTNEFYQLTGNEEGYFRGKLVWSSSNKKIYAAGYSNEEYGVFAIDFVP